MLFLVWEILMGGKEKNISLPFINFCDHLLNELLYVCTYAKKSQPLH